MIEYLVSLTLGVLSCYSFLLARVSYNKGDFIAHTIVYGFVSILFGLFAIVEFIRVFKENRKEKQNEKR